MPCLPLSIQNRVKSKIARKEVQLDTLNKTYDKLIDPDGTGDIESYKFDSGTASQSAKLRNPEDVAKEISRLEKEIEALYRKLSGRGLVNQNMRRYG